MQAYSSGSISFVFSIAVLLSASTTAVESWAATIYDEGASGRVIVGNYPDAGTGSAYIYEAVPEPSALLLPAVGLLGVSGCYRRRPDAASPGDHARGRIIFLVMTVCLVCVAGQSNAGVIAYYPFDSTFTDSSASGNDLTISAGAPVITSEADEWKFGDGAADFNSTTSDQAHLRLDSEINFSAADAWSISFWGRRRAGTDAKSGMILGNLQATDFIWTVDSGQGVAVSGGGLRFRNSDNTNYDYAEIDDDHAYHHWVVIADGSGNITSYRDNVSLGTQAAVTSFDITHVGQAYSNTIQSYNGQIDELYIFDNAIGSGVVASLFNGNRVPEPSAALLLCLGLAALAIGRRQRLMLNSRNAWIILVCLTFVVAFSQDAAATQYKVFLLGGQSNMDGRAAPSSLPAPLQSPQPDVRLYEDWTLGALQPDSDEFGPEVTFGRSIADAFPGDEFAIIKHAKGGKSLDVDWDPNDGSTYSDFRTQVTKGKEKLEEGGNSTEIVGMLWTQGERDAKLDRTTAQYQADLTEFIADVRTEYGADLPFFLSQLSVLQTDISEEQLGEIRLAQANVAAGDSNAYLINTDSFGVKSTDNLHFNAAGQQSLGQAFATSYVATVPEPSTGLLSLVGLVGCILTRRRS
jgi:hypothetical protein